MKSTFWSLDTETTGFDPKSGHKIIEIGAIKIENGMPTDEVFHVYVDPQREIPLEAVEVHNLTREDVVELGNGQIFKDIANDLLDCLRGQVLVIHNAGFDMDFLDFELESIGLDKLSDVCDSVIDSLHYAQTIHPSKKNNLDALAKRYGVDNSNREYHGALLDAEILASVFMSMTTAQQHVSKNEVMKSMQSKRVAFTLSDVIKPIPSEISNTLKVMELESDLESEHKNYLSSIDSSLDW